METKIVLADAPEDIIEEVSILYRLGVTIEDIEYIISKKINTLSTQT